MDAFAVIKRKLTAHPMGGPDRPELDAILRLLFTPEEADLVQHLSYRAESAEAISNSTGVPADEVTARCEALARKGVALALARKGVRSYGMLPMLPGLYEYPLMLGPRTGLDYERLRALWLRYYEAAWGAEMASHTPSTRVLPVNQTLEDQSTILPFEQVSDYLASAKIIAVGPCPCRIIARRCDRPVETCFYLNSGARFLIEVGAAREVSPAEALAIFTTAEEAGLVHVGSNAATGGDVICNCCPCCCIQLRNRIEGRGLGPAAAYACAVDERACNACGVCLERCPTKSITIDNVATIDTATCFGCGLCASACPTDALKLARRPDAPAPLASLRDWAYQVAAEKGRLEEFQQYLPPN